MSVLTHPQPAPASRIRLSNRSLWGCLLAFALNFIAFYPGFLSPDPLDQYRQALANDYDTWHPPVMAYTWHLLNYLHRGPQLMLALQLLFLWASCYLMMRSVNDRRWKIVVFFVFLAAPFIQNFSGWIVKDSMMTLSWTLAGAGLFHELMRSSRTRMRRTVIGIVTALLLLYGSWMRYNAIVALPPLALLWSYTVFPKLRVWAKLVAAALLVGLILVGQPAFNDLIGARKSYTEIQIFFHDIAGVYARTGKNFFPASLLRQPGFDTAYIRTHYDKVDVTKVLWNADNKTILVFSRENNEALKAAWKQLLAQDPVDYAKLRLEIYERFLILHRNPELQYYFPWIHPNDYGFKVSDNFLYRVYDRYISLQAGMPYFRTWFWILLNVLLFALSGRIRNRRIRLFFLCLALSGFLYTTPQLLVANTVRDFRYIYWSCLACTLALLAFWADRKTMRKAI